MPCLPTTVAVAFVLLASGAGCGGDEQIPVEQAAPDQTATAPDSEESTAARTAVGNGVGGVRLTDVGSFSEPVYIAFSKHYRDHAYVVEKAGRVRVLKNGSLRQQPLLDIRDRVSSGGERGLLSLAFHPNKKYKKRLYAYYTNRRGDIQIDEFRLRNGDRAKPGSSRTVIRISHRYAENHNGGQVQFGPNGQRKLLYLATGDGGGGGDPQGNGQNPRTLLGKLLRINPLKRGKRPYSIPKGNPYKDRPGGRKEIYALGLRNPYRFAFDSRNGQIAIGDVGQSGFEEVNVVTKKKLGGANFGWNRWEGREQYDSSTPTPKNKQHTRPIHTYRLSGGNCAITGGYVVRDRRLSSLWGRYLYADFCAGDLRSLIPKRPSARDDRALGLSVDNPSGFGESPRGVVYIASLNGPVYRVDPE